MLNRSESNTLSPPRLILAHADAAIAALIAGGFRRLDWDVSMARTGPEARWLAGRLRPDTVILHTDLPEESGWLTCDKLTREQPLACVILVSDNLSPRNQKLAFFVGASALISSGGGVASRIDELVIRRGPGEFMTTNSERRDGEQGGSTLLAPRAGDETICNRSIPCHHSVPRSQRGSIKGSIPCLVQTLAGPSKSSWWKITRPTRG